MKITKYERLRNGKYKVYLDNDDIITLYEDVILNNNLLLNKNIGDIDSILNDNNEYDVYNKSIKYISTKMRSKKDINTYLSKYYDNEIVNRTIDKLLKNGYSTLSLGYVGIYETTKLVKGISNQSKEGHEFSIKLLKYINEKIKEWKKETGLGFIMCQTQDTNICKKFLINDRNEYGEIKDITDKEYYTSGYLISEDDEKDILKKIEFENEYQKLTPGGSITYLKISDIKDFEEIINYIYNNIKYVGFLE